MLDPTQVKKQLLEQQEGALGEQKGEVVRLMEQLANVQEEVCVDNHLVESWKKAESVLQNLVESVDIFFWVIN